MISDCCAVQTTVTKHPPCERGACISHGCQLREKSVKLSTSRGSSLHCTKYERHSVCVGIQRRTSKDDNMDTFCQGHSPSYLLYRQKWPLLSNMPSTSYSDNTLCTPVIFHKRRELKSKHLFSSLSECGSDFAGLSKEKSHTDGFTRELAALVVPSMAEQALQPLAQLMETAFVGRLGSVELGAVGVSLSVFNLVTKLFNIPLLNVTASFVAEDSANVAFTMAHRDTRNSLQCPASYEDNAVEGQRIKDAGKVHLPSVSTALVLAAALGILEGAILSFGAGPFLTAMGISAGSPMRLPSEQYLALRALGAPAVVITLAAQGMFRGLKNTKTSLYASGVGNIMNAFLFPICIFSLRFGIAGAAIATVVSQYFMAFLLLWNLSKKLRLLPHKLEELNFSRYLKSGGFLFGRTVAVTATTTLATAMAARQGPVFMAGHQICVQVWLAASLLTDSVAAAGQALLATSYSNRDYNRAKKVALSIIKIGLFSGLALMIVLCTSLGLIAKFFTTDADVLQVIRDGLLFVAGSQPINALAFIFDGLHYGVSDFSYSAYSMMIVGAISSSFMVSTTFLRGAGVWTGLVIFMGLRMAAGFWRLADKRGPWSFLREHVKQSAID